MSSERTRRLDVDSGSRSEKRFDVSSLEEHLPGQQKVPATTAVRAPSPAYSWSSGEANFGDLPDDWYDTDKYLRLEMEELRAKTAAASQDGAGPSHLPASAPPTEDDGHRRATQGPGAVVTVTPPPTVTNTLGPSGKGGLPANDGDRQLCKGGGKMRNKKRARTAVPRVNVALDNTSAPSIRGLETKGRPGHWKVSAAVPATTAVRAPSPAYSWSSGEANFGDLPDDWYDTDKYLSLEMEERRAKTAAASQDGAGPFAPSAPPMEDDGHQRVTQGPGTAVTGTLTPMAPGGAAGVAEDDEAELLRHCDEETKRLIRVGGPMTSSTTVIRDDAGGPEFYGLGSEVRKTLYGIFNISCLHPWQREVLDKHLFHEDGQKKNGLILAPTSGGKTMVAIVLALHSLLVFKKDAIMVLPYVAIVAEKVDQLKRLATRMVDHGAPCFAVAEYAGSKGRLPLPPRRTSTAILKATNTLYVCTIEKASIVWRHITREPPPFNVGCVIVDELQMLGEPGRGGIFEELVTSVIFWAGASTRTYALSATVGNAGALASYLGGGGVDPSGCLLHRVLNQDREARVREFVVVSGAAFTVRREKDDGATALFTSRPDDGSFDVVAELDHLTLQGMPIQGDDGDPHRLWLRIHQLRLHLQATALIKLPHRPGSERLTFPPVSRVPTDVMKYCEEMTDGTDASVRSKGLDPSFVRAVSALDRHDGVAVASPPVDPYAGRKDNLRKTDAAAWDMRVVAILAADAVRRGRTMLVFCPTKASAAVTCRALTAVCNALRARADPSWPTPSPVVLEERNNITASLTEESDGGADDVLLQGIHNGVAFHSTALGEHERTVIEGAFARRVISIICCTTTLAAGVNLPCDTVVIRTPWICGEFLTCTRYMQQIGRAGRTGLSRPDPTSYVIVASEDVGRFQSLLQCHVEDVPSQLLQSPPYYLLGGVRGKEPAPRAGSCLTRFIVGLIGTSRIARLSNLVEAYRCTLLYHVGGPREPDGDVGEQAFRQSTQPLLMELKVLIADGHLQLLLLSEGENGAPPPQLMAYPTTVYLGRRRSGAGLADRQPDVEGAGTRNHRCATPDEVDTFIALLEGASAGLAPDSSSDDVVLPDVSLTATSFATATDLATISMSDAASFMKNARRGQRSVMLHNPLLLLTMSIEPQSCRLLGDDDDIRVNVELASKMENHEDAETIEAMGITVAMVEDWLARRRIRCNADFNARLALLWAALFVKGVFERPQDFNELCRHFGHDRSSGAEFIGVVAQRCFQLRNFCLNLGGSDLWWYPPLAGAIVQRIRDACAEELRPLLAIRHVTRGRARRLYDAGYLGVAEVAAIFPPTRISDLIPNLGTWRAIDMVLHARTIVRHEAVQHAAMSRDRYTALARRP